MSIIQIGQDNDDILSVQLILPLLNLNLNTQNDEKFVLIFLLMWYFSQIVSLADKPDKMLH